MPRGLLYLFHAAIGANAIAALRAAIGRGSVSGAVPIGGTSRVRKDGSTIATVSGNTASAAPKLA
ncbi:MAG: hypothetical protein ACR2NN_05420 [Bryobacteraceae bacterium]